MRALCHRGRLSALTATTKQGRHGMRAALCFVLQKHMKREIAMKFTRAYAMCVVFAMITLCLGGCILPWDPVLRYSGEYPNLVATAIHSIPGVQSDADDQVLVLEQDQFGRVLFGVCLPRTNMDDQSYEDQILAVVIIQSSDDTSVSFYSDKNYHLAIIDGGTVLSRDVISSHFSDQEIEELKRQNAWDCQPADADPSLTKIPLTLEKNGTFSDALDSITEKYLGTNHKDTFFAADANGLEIYFVLNIVHPEGALSPEYIHSWYLVAVTSEGIPKDASTSIRQIKPDDLPNLPAIVAEFKQANGWNTCP